MAGSGGKAGGRGAESRGRIRSDRSAPYRPKTDPASIAEHSLISEIGLDTEPTAAARRRGRGPDVLAQTTAGSDKEKVSITLDRPLVDEIRAQSGGRALSSSINELLRAALAQRRLADLVDEMEQEAGQASPEAYERVLAQWFTED